VELDSTSVLVRTLNFNGTYESITFWTVQTNKVTRETMKVSSFTPLFLYPNSYPIFNLNDIRPRMVELSTLQAVREVVTIVGVIAGLTFYFLTVQNENKSRKIQIGNRMRGVQDSREMALISLELLEMQWEDFDDFVRKYDSTVNHDNYSKRALMFGAMGSSDTYLNIS